MQADSLKVVDFIIPEAVANDFCNSCIISGLDRPENYSRFTLPACIVQASGKAGEGVKKRLYLVFRRGGERFFSKSVGIFLERH